MKSDIIEMAIVARMLNALRLAMIIISQHYPENETCCEDNIAEIRATIKEIMGLYPDLKTC